MSVNQLKLEKNRHLDPKVIRADAVLAQGVVRGVQRPKEREI